MAKRKTANTILDTNKIGAQSFENDTPSKITDKYWVHASEKVQTDHERKYNDCKPGKWLAFVDIEALDATWIKVKQATESGILGPTAKAATAKPNPNASSKDNNVICIYTYNWQDKEDVYRVKESLRSIGVETTLYYKADEDTIARKYKENGATNISKYISKATKSHKKFELGSLHGVGDNKIEILNNIGIHNFDDLLSFDTSQKLEGAGVSSLYINKLKISALAQIENKIFRLRPVSIPNNEMVHFDIETDLHSRLNTKKVWSVAIHHNDKTQRFYADTWDQEGEILNDFMQYLKDLEYPNLLCYSGSYIDKNVLASAFKRHDLDADYFINCNHFDLCTMLKQNFVMPMKSYGLKEVGKFLGYKFNNEHIDGLHVAMQYMRCQATGEELPDDIFHYIDDDVKAMDHIIKHLQNGKDIKDVFDHNIAD